MLEKLLELLGEDNAKRLEDGITDIILEQIRDDFKNSENYILVPDDITEFVEKCKEKAFANIEAEMVKKLEDAMRKFLLGNK